jgi:hypothetical protein
MVGETEIPGEYKPHPLQHPPECFGSITGRTCRACVSECLKCKHNELCAMVCIGRHIEHTWETLHALQTTLQERDA